MEKTWRLILDKARDAAMNMAIDEAIMLSQADGIATPTLRIYKWLCPCVSVGRFQNLDDIPVAARNLPVVQRPTGGGAVLHDEFSFTYSMIYREDSGALPRGVVNSYREIHTVISEAFTGMGIKTGLYPAERSANPSGACFTCPVEHDVVVNGRKIAGAAQRRKFGVVLHQGEVSLDLDVRIKSSYNHFLNKFIEGFSNRFKAVFIEARISDKEESLAEKLLLVTEEVNR